MSVLAGLMLAGSGQAYARTEPVTLTFSHFLGPDSFFQVDLIEPWARALERESKGQLRVSIVNNTSPLGEVTSQAANVEAGRVNIALGLRGAEGARFPGTSVVEVPLAVRDASNGSRALWRLYKEGDLASEYAGYKVLAIFVQNPGLIHTTEKPVAVPRDMVGLRLRAPHAAAASALEMIGAKPAILQVNDVMPALDAGELDGIVTNWGNPLPGFDAKMRYHTDVQFYTAAFFILMNKQKFEALPASTQRLINRHSGLQWVEQIGKLWNKWDAEVRERSLARGQTIFVPDEAQMSEWKQALDPAVEAYLDKLGQQFPQARPVHERFMQYQQDALTSP